MALRYKTRPETRAEEKKLFNLPASKYYDELRKSCFNVGL